MAEQTQQKTIIIESHQNEGVNLWGVSLGTGYPWFVELTITLIVMGILYGMKRYIDIWFDKHKAKKVKEGK
jgi:hypothetical protein